MFESRPRVVFLLTTAVVFAVAFYRSLAAPPPPGFYLEPDVATGAAAGDLYETRTVSSGATPAVHSATAVELSDGRLRAFWYGGSREGAEDVAIYTAVFDVERGWDGERIVATRAQTARDVGRYVRKLGNPVAAMDRQDRLWLFYVSVSVGGWSGSAINYRVSSDSGETWSSARRLVTSPFLNLSTLVRGAAFDFEDGTLGLPVYHEFLGKFGELLRLDSDGHVLSKTRLSWGYSSLQPSVVPLTRTRAVAFLRSSGTSPRRILSVRSEDGGRHWSRLEPTSLANPDAAVSAIRLRGATILLAFNDSTSDRGNLKLALSRDGGKNFRVLHELEPPSPSNGPSRFAYPWLLQGRGGDIHLLYTWNRRRIVHLRFNETWLAGRAR